MATSTSTIKETTKHSIALQAIPNFKQRCLIKGLILQANINPNQLAQLESEILAMGPHHAVKVLVSTLKDEKATQSELELACMCLLRFGNDARGEVLRFALEAETERQRWLGDFLVHQFGLKRVA